MEKFISCDWGTSALRLRVIDINNNDVLAEVAGEHGIADTYNLWNQSGKATDEKLYFYQSVLAGQLSKLEEKLDFSLQGMPLIISGMASSSIGMLELPYKEIPFGIMGKDLLVKTIEAGDDFKHQILLISGVKTADDAMRGEETQLIGCLNSGDKSDHLFIFPGTHSKHITIKNGEVADIKTYMTGEFFDLLSQKSILSNSVEENNDLLNADNLKSFEKGVAESIESNVLHSSFLVRTNNLFGKLSKQENYLYLSGLLIGTELKELINNTTSITLVGDELLRKFYGTALRKLGINKVKYMDAGKAMIEGHSKFYNLYNSTLTAGNIFIKQ